jgi:hypothetical protein
MFATFLNALPTVLAGLLCLFALYGFWRGLSLRPHTPAHRAQDGVEHYWSSGH